MLFCSMDPSYASRKCTCLGKNCKCTRSKDAYGRQCACVGRCTCGKSTMRGGVVTPVNGVKHGDKKKDDCCDKK